MPSDLPRYITPDTSIVDFTTLLGQALASNVPLSKPDKILFSKLYESLLEAQFMWKEKGIVTLGYLLTSWKNTEATLSQVPFGQGAPDDVIQRFRERLTQLEAQGGCTIKSFLGAEKKIGLDMELGDYVDYLRRKKPSRSPSTSFVESSALRKVDYLRPEKPSRSQDKSFAESSALRKTAAVLEDCISYLNDRGIYTLGGMMQRIDFPEIFCAAPPLKHNPDAGKHLMLLCGALTRMAVNGGMQPPAWQDSAVFRLAGSRSDKGGNER